MKNYYEYEFEGQHCVTDLADCGLWPFFRTVGAEIAMSDCTGVHVTKIVYGGRQFRYVGWQPGMKFEFVGVGDNAAETYVVWLPQYDH